MAQGKKAAAQTINILERREKALNLRRSGLSIREIAARLDSDPSTIHTDIKVMLEAAIKENVDNAEALRAMEIERLDRMMLAISPQVNNGHLGAIDRAIRISERRSKLLGLDMPIKTELSGSITSTVKAYKGFTPDDWDADVEPFARED